MSGDYSKHRFDPNRDYSGVLMQQGRVQLDSDWNEQVEIQDRHLRAETADIVGRCGVPQETPDGFNIELTAGALTIGEGRIYVDGLLAENHGAVPKKFDTVLAEMRGTASLAYEAQPYLLQPLPLPTPPTGRIIIYLDIWQREVTFLKDPDLIEKAVGVDTTTRLQTVWQVRFVLVDDDVTCDTPIDQILPLQNATRHSVGRLSTDAIGVDADQDPCVIPPSGGFRGLENRLYRVEIHDPGPEGTATFKWSGNNTVLTTAVTVIDPSTLTKLTVETTRKDSILQFKPGDWVEVTDDTREFAFQPGVMREIFEVDHGARTITLVNPLPNAPGDEFPTDVDGNPDPSVHTRMRRWSQKGQILDGDGNVLHGEVDDNGGVITVPADPATSVQLNDGVTAAFSTDSAETNPPSRRYRVGDYWNFAARTADSSVEILDNAPPRGIHHHFCRLALLEPEGNNWVVRDDCRPLFPPLTRLTHFYYVSGDGQEGPTPGGQLPKPLQVAVFNGHMPVLGASVRFEIVEGTGGSLNSLGAVITVDTNANGIADCTWNLEVATPLLVSQQVEATLLDDAGQTLHHPIRFNATPTREHEPGIRVTDVLLRADGSGGPLLNDAILLPVNLLQGLLLVCDAPVDDSSVNTPTFIVTVDIPAEKFNGLFIGSKITIVLDGDTGATVPGANITGIFWKPTDDAIILLIQELSGIVEPLLVRVTAKGSFIFSDGPPRRYLDGETYGVPALDGSTAPDGRTATHLDLSDGSGDLRRGGDFAMWFWFVRPRPNVLLDDINVANNLGQTPQQVFQDNFDSSTPDQPPVLPTVGNWSGTGATVRVTPPELIEPFAGNLLEFIAGFGPAFAEFAQVPAAGFRLDCVLRVPSGVDNDQGRGFFIILEDAASNVGFQISYNGPLSGGQLVDVGGAGNFDNLPVIPDTSYQLRIEFTFDSATATWNLIVTMNGVTQSLGTPRNLSGVSFTRIRIASQPIEQGGVSPVASLSATTLDFGDVPTDTTSRKFFTITNTSNDPVSIEGFDFDDASFGTSRQPVTLQPGESARVGVNFSPTSAGIVTAELQIRTDKGPMTLNVSGTGQS